MSSDMNFYLKRILDAEDLYYLLKEMKNRSEDLTDEYNSNIVEAFYHDDFIITGLFGRTKRKCCDEQWNVNMVGYIIFYINKNCMYNEIDVVDFYIDVKYKDKDEVIEMVSKYVKELFRRYMVDSIRFHTRIESKEYYDCFFDTEMIELKTFIMTGD